MYIQVFTQTRFWWTTSELTINTGELTWKQKKRIFSDITSVILYHLSETWASEIESFQCRKSLKARIFGYAGRCRLPLILNVFPSMQMKTQRINPKGVFSTCTYSHDILKTATMEHLRSYSGKWSWPLLIGESWSVTEEKQKDSPPHPSYKLDSGISGISAIRYPIP